MTQANQWQQRHMDQILVEMEISSDGRLPLEYLEPIKALWRDSGVQQAVAKGNEYALHDNLS